MHDTLELTCIRCDTEHDLADAVALAARILKKSPQPRHLERTTFDFSTQLFAGVALVVAYAHKNGTVTDVLQYLVDPAWDCSLQMLDSFQQAEHAFRQLQAAAWRHDFLNSIKAKSYTEVETLVRRCHAHWTTALNSLTTIAPEKRQPRASIQVFNPEAVANALHQNASLRDDKRAGSARILEDAQRNHGYRTVPDCKYSGAQLQSTQCYFENLEQLIARLQSRLVLAGCMSPEAFHILPF